LTKYLRVSNKLDIFALDANANYIMQPTITNFPHTPRIVFRIEQHWFDGEYLYIETLFETRLENRVDFVDFLKEHFSGYDDMVPNDDHVVEQIFLNRSFNEQQELIKEFIENA
jgi:hypothetical protein